MGTNISEDEPAAGVPIKVAPSSKMLVSNRQTARDHTPVNNSKG
jgi:hypothetical protein